MPDRSLTVPDELWDPVYRLSNLYHIRTKMEGEEGIDVMFEPNAVQRKIFQAIEDGWKRIIILKPRKLGCTTAIAIYLLDKTLYQPNQICRTIAHRRETAEELFNDIALHAFEGVEESGLLLVDQRAGSVRELAFNNGSRYGIGVEARGLTPTKVHFTEVAYYEDEKKFEDSLESVPRTSLGIFESTANGKGNWFERNFTRNWTTLKAGGRPEIYPLFFAWFDDPNNREKWHPETVLYYPTDCAEMKARFDLDDEQLLWWDRKKYSLGARLPELYPSTPEEAFIFSTGKVYGDEFREELNVIPPVSFPEYELSMDWGQTNPLVILAVHRDADDNFIVFKELYRPNMQIIEVRRWLELHCPEKKDKFGYFHIRFPDPSVFNNTQIQDVIMRPGQAPPEHRYSIADEFKKHKITLHRGVQNDVLVGITRMKEYLKFNPNLLHPFKRDALGNRLKGAPRLFITENCESTRKEFDLYRWPKDPAGALTQHSYEAPMKKNDHAMDALRYAIVTWTKGEHTEVDPPPPPNTIAYHLDLQKKIELLQSRYGASGYAGRSETY